MFASPMEVANLASRMKVEVDLKDHWKTETGYCEHFFHGLGATEVHSLDASDYEDATIVHDLNNPISPNLFGQYDSVVDGGTLEHVFDFPRAIQSCMRMVAPGGHYIGLTPANNLMGHGFYQFSPELYFRIFTPENGFELLTVLVHSEEVWLKVTDPSSIGGRGTLNSSVPLMMAVLARRISEPGKFHVPQQSDYLETWSVVDSIRGNAPREGEGNLRHAVRKYVPRKVKTLMRSIQGSAHRSSQFDGIDEADSRHFKRVRMW